MNYLDFLKSKELIVKNTGFEISRSLLNPMLFDFQKDIVKWALLRGKAAIFADCGLGKTPMQLDWAINIWKRTKRPVLIVAPLAVSKQTKQEGKKFGVSVNICNNDRDISKGINITNYEKLHKFDASIFSGVVIDESSILKNFTGIRRNEIMQAFSRTQYKLACTATPAPNDYEELGNHCQFLNVMTRMEMLAMFFINDTSKTGNWRLKGHVKDNIFWKWLSTWAVMLSKPSDLGYEDNNFLLPDIQYYEHMIKSNEKPKKSFFSSYARDLNERRKIRKDTIKLRCNEAAKIINSSDDLWVIWCGLNEEGDILVSLIDNAIQVAGRHSDEVKESRMFNFSVGKIPRIVTKPKIAGLGMNWQVCHNAAFVGLSDSWEQFYQAVRRIWRFGQISKVNIHIFLEEREGSVLSNIKRKDKQAKEMINNMIIYMSDLVKNELNKSNKQVINYKPNILMEIPKWI